MSKITVLIAIYNAEAYLRKCLDSLRTQSLQDFQALCIDDCSTDSSASIIEEYAAKDKRFIHMKTEVNSGPAVARNLGIEAADGEYITMLDSDDWYATDTLERAYEALKSGDDIDCAVLRLVLHEDSTGVETEFKNEVESDAMTGSEAFKLSLDWKIHGLYVVRTSIQKLYPYDTTCRLYSDDNTTRIHYLHSRRIVFCDGTYYYRKHACSQSNTCSIRRFDFLQALLSLKRQLTAEAGSGNLPDRDSTLDKLETHRWRNLVACYTYFLQNRKSFTVEEQEEIRSKFAFSLRTIEPERIPWSIKAKVGYFPIRRLWMFHVQESIYMGLRNMKHLLLRH